MSDKGVANDERRRFARRPRVTFANNSNLQKQEQNSQYFEIKLDTQKFSLHHSSITCILPRQKAHLDSVRASFHAYRSYY